MTQQEEKDTKVLCAEIELPPQHRKNLGINGFAMKASEIESFVEDELNNGGQQSFTVKIHFSFKTKKWIESLPEADI